MPAGELGNTQHAPTLPQEYQEVGEELAPRPSLQSPFEAQGEEGGFQQPPLPGGVNTRPSYYPLGVPLSTVAEETLSQQASTMPGSDGLPSTGLSQLCVFLGQKFFV